MRKEVGLRLLVFGISMCLGTLIANCFYKDTDLVNKEEQKVNECITRTNTVKNRCNDISLSEQLSDEDKAVIIKLLIEERLKDIKLLNSGGVYILGSNKVRFVSTENIKQSLLPNVPGNLFYLLTPKEIASEDFNKKGISYISFGSFALDKDYVTITIYENYRMPIYIENFGFIYQFHKSTCGWSFSLIGQTRLTS